MFESLVQGIGDFRVSLLRAIEVIQHPFSKKNRKQIDDYTFSLQKLIETLEGFKANVDVITDSVKEQNKPKQNNWSWGGLCKQFWVVYWAM